MQEAVFVGLGNSLDYLRSPDIVRPAVVAPVQDEDEGPTAPIRRQGPRLGRNDPCACGSGKKFKRCCLGGPRQ